MCVAVNLMGSILLPWCNGYTHQCRWIDTAGSRQEYGLQKNACYGLFVRDEAQVTAEGTEISYCSESALFLRDRQVHIDHTCDLRMCVFTCMYVCICIEFRWCMHDAEFETSSCCAC